MYPWWEMASCPISSAFIKACEPQVRIVGYATQANVMFLDPAVMSRGIWEPSHGREMERLRAAGSEGCRIEH